MASVYEAAQLSGSVYPNGAVIPANWNIVATTEGMGIGLETGLFAAAYQNSVTGEIVIAYRGTERGEAGIKDWTNNLQLVQDKVPDQYYEASEFYSRIVDQYGSTASGISLTGHSLGGALASLIAAVNDKEANVFDAPGVKGLLDNPDLAIKAPDPNGTYPDIRNYNAIYDPVSQVFSNQIGQQFNIDVHVQFPDWLLSLVKGDAYASEIIQYAYDQHRMDLMIQALAPQIYSGANAMPATQAGTGYVDLNTYTAQQWSTRDSTLDETYTLQTWTDSNGVVHGNDFNGGFGDDLINGTSKGDNIDGMGDVDGNSLMHDNDIIYGNGGNDAITGGLGIDTIFGGTENDFLVGNSGQDYLDGEDGNDIIEGGTDGDTLYGGIGDDIMFGDYAYLGTTDGQTYVEDYVVGTVISNAGDDYMDGGDGNDHMFGGRGNDTLDGGRDNDLIAGERGNDYILGGDGDDALFGDTAGGVGTQTINWSNEFATFTATVAGASLNYNPEISQTTTVNTQTAGSFTYTNISIPTIGVDDGNDFIDGGIGNDRIDGGGGDDVLLGGTGNDIIYGVTGLDTISGDEGDDTLYGGAGDDILVGGDGRDVLLGQEDNDFLFGGAGSDYLSGGIGNDNLFGGGENDYLTGGDGADVLDGGDGDDVLDGGDGDDELYGLSGSDTLYGGLGNDLLYGGADNDTISGGDGNDTVVGSTGSDSLYGDGGSDQLSGGTEDDVLSGGDGNDVLTGEQGSDILVGGTGADTLVGGSENDFLYGEADNDALDGGDGDDVLVGGVGIDTLYGGAGNDTLDGGDDNDVLDGGDGINVLSGGAGMDTLYGGSSTDTLDGGDGDDTLSSDLGDDALSGGAGNDLLYAGVGNDVLDGGDGSDQLDGESGNDVLAGGSGNDVLFGGNGDDVLAGGTGDDALQGGAGNDVFVFGAGDGHDVVTDFESGDQLSLGINMADAQFVQRGDNLIIYANGGADTLVVGGWFNDLLNEISFADGSTLYANEVQAMLTSPDTYNTGPQAATPMPNQSAEAGVELLFNVPAGTFTDTDLGEMLTYSATLADGSPLPSWVTLDAASGVFSGTPSAGDVGSLQIALTAMDAAGAAASTTFSMDVFPNGGNPAAGIAVWGTDDAEVLVGTGGNDWIDGNGGNDTVHAGGGDDEAAGGYGADALYGGDGNDWLFGGFNDGGEGFGMSQYYEWNGVSTDTIYENDGADDLNGGAGDDRLYGGVGNDVLDGGSGNDSLYGGRGDDTYVFGYGSGQDWIQEHGAAADVDTVKFGAGITVADLSIRFNDVPAYGDLYIGINGTNDQLGIEWPNYVPNYDWQGYNTIEQFVFDDGAVLSAAEIEAMATINHGPVGGVIADQATAAGSAFSFQVPADAFSDPDVGDTLTYNVDPNSLPGWLQFDAATGSFSGTPQAGDVGTYNVYVNATDGIGWATDYFTITVSQPVQNHAPTVVQAIAAQTANEDAPFAFQIPANTFVDIDAGDSLALAATLFDGTALPDWITFDATTGTFSGTPENGDVGSVNVLVTATDQSGATASSTFTITTQNTNDTPIVSSAIANQTVVANSAFVLTAASSFSDVDAGDTLNFAIASADGSALPLWLSIDSATGVIQGTPGIADVGALNLVVSATDASGASVSQLFTVDVNAPVGAVVGTAGNDVYIGTAGDEVYLGGSGNDMIIGADGNDTLLGQAGNDVIFGGAGADAMYGGSGNDSYYVDGLADSVVENANEGADAVFSTITYTLGENIENLTLNSATSIDGTGNALNNVIRGNNSVNVLDGGAGNDTLDGRGGDDTLFGGDGNDVFFGGGGADTMYGGAGDDQYNIVDATDTIVENANAGIDLVVSFDTTALGDNIENLVLVGWWAADGTGNALNNVLTGGDGDNVLTGGAGDDALAGRAGNDTYQFGRGDQVDTISENDPVSTNDQVVFSTGVASDQLWFTQSGNDLQVSIIGTGDQVVVKDWYAGSQYQVDQFTTSSGQVLLDSQVQQLVDAMAGFTPSASGQLTLPPDVQAALDPIFAQTWSSAA